MSAEALHSTQIKNQLREPLIERSLTKELDELIQIARRQFRARRLNPQSAIGRRDKVPPLQQSIDSTQFGGLQLFVRTSIHGSSQ